MMTYDSFIFSFHLMLGKSTKDGGVLEMLLY